MEPDIFLSQVKQYVAGMSKEGMECSLIDMAKYIPDGKQQEFLKYLLAKSYASKKVNNKIPYQPRMSEQMAAEKQNEVEVWLDRIENQELYLEATGYEDYSQGYWHSEWIWEYYDTMGIGAKVEMAVSFALDCINDRRYEAALNILDRILDLEVFVKNDWDDFTATIEELQKKQVVKVDLKQLALMTLYADYQVRDRKERAADMYTYFSYPFFSDIHMEEVRHIGREELKEENVFWDDWIELLSSKTGDLESRLLREAIFYIKGTDGLAEMAKRNYLKHPALFLEAMGEYEKNHEYEKMTLLGLEAVNRIDKKYRIRGKIAFKTSLAEYCLGNEDKMKELWYETYVSDMTQVNFLRLFVEDNMAKTWGMKGKDLSKTIQKGNVYDNNNEEMKENRVDSTTASFLEFLSGKFEKVKKCCVNPEGSLGWSGEFIRYGIRIFLLYLYSEESLQKATKILADEISVLFGFQENDEFYYFTNDLFVKTGKGRETFWMAFCKWKKYFAMSDAEKTKYLRWAEDIIHQRTIAIVGGKFRNHYESAALLISVLGEVKESMGCQGAKQEAKEKYKKMFPRHSAFNGAMNEYV